MPASSLLPSDISKRGHTGMDKVLVLIGDLVVVLVGQWRKQGLNFGGSIQ